MANILLVEPDYKNKYPPIGLMKIATYHKRRGDNVVFYKGKAPYPTVIKSDRVYITSLFTFYYDILVDTIRHYQNFLPEQTIYIGGILATIMQDKLQAEVGQSHVIPRQLTSSSMLGYDDNVNIDELPIDYDILDDVRYKYPAADNFITYTTRGCPRKCSFCAVSILEPEFKYTNNLREQITEERRLYGDKRNILLMDNNILVAPNTKLKEICDTLVDLGFVKDQPTFVPDNPAKIFFRKLETRLETKASIIILVDNFVEYFLKFITRVKNQEISNRLSSIIPLLQSGVRTQTLLENKSFIIDVVERYRSKKMMQRYVDFNQGIDARLLTEEKMKILSVLPLRPFRLAYDSSKCTKDYIRAFDIAYKYGIRHFSNYMLFNFNETPGDFWNRACRNIRLYNSYEGLHAFSFPMKLAPINMTDRSFIGKHWNKKYLSAMNVILNVTKGVIAREKDFFMRAYGKDIKEFHEILTMPNEFIKYRQLFEECGLTEAWRRELRALDHNERKCLLKYLSGETDTSFAHYKILRYYKITKHQLVSGTLNLNDYL